MWITSSLTTAKFPTVIALGNFDGVHLGHREVICPISGKPGESGLCDSLEYCLDTVDQLALDLAASALMQGYSDRQFSWLTAASAPIPPQAPPDAPVISTVVTFFPHPQEYFSGVARPLLTPLGEKALHLKRMGVEQLVLLPFNQQLATLSPEQFVEVILIGYLKAQRISVGQDFRFGHQRAGSTADLQAIAQRHGTEVAIVPLKQQGGERISSSRIRQALAEADLETARQLLGRPYSLTGRVVQGQQLGRTIGFPTANLRVPADKFLPRSGVYSVRVFGAKPSPEPPLAGVMNIGHRPTVNGTVQTIEVHLLNWSGDLYGQTLTVTLDTYLRPEQRFESLESLKRQIQADCEAAMAI